MELKFKKKMNKICPDYNKFAYMRIAIQRVVEAQVKIEENTIGQIQNGLLVLLGIEEQDNEDDVVWLTTKLVQMRIFSDENGLMNKSIQEVDGDILLVSQFTLFASTKKGNRPSFIRSAKPEQAIPLYHLFIEQCKTKLGKNIQTGQFGGDMKVYLCNDGPVTIWIDSKNKE